VPACFVVQRKKNEGASANLVASMDAPMEWQPYWLTVMDHVDLLKVNLTD